MNPAEIWQWIDTLEGIPVDHNDEEADDFFGDWSQALLEELLQGRAIVANTSFEGGMTLFPDQAVHIIGCTFVGGEVRV